MTEKETRSVLAAATTKKPIAESYSIAIVAVVFFILFFGVATFLSYRQLETARSRSLTHDKTTANLLADLILEHNKATTGILLSYAHRPLFLEAVKNKDLAGVHRHLLDLKKNAEIDLTFSYGQFPIRKTSWFIDFIRSLKRR